MTFLSKLLHGFGALDRTIAQRCCGRRWRDLPRHRQFSHGETLAALPCSEPGCDYPASGWAYDLMGDGQAIGGRSVCVEHLAGVGE